jgi:hypothetical protein
MYRFRGDWSDTVALVEDATEFMAEGYLKKVRRRRGLGPGEGGGGSGPRPLGRALSCLPAPAGGGGGAQVVLQQALPRLCPTRPQSKLVRPLAMALVAEADLPALPPRNSWRRTCPPRARWTWGLTPRPS